MVKEELQIKKEGGAGKYLGFPEHFVRRKHGMLLLRRGPYKTEVERVVKQVLFIGQLSSVKASSQL